MVQHNRSCTCWLIIPSTQILLTSKAQDHGLVARNGGRSWGQRTLARTLSKKANLDDNIYEDDEFELYIQ